MKTEKDPAVPHDDEVIPGRERIVIADLGGDGPLGDQPVGTRHEDEYQD